MGARAARRQDLFPVAPCRPASARRGAPAAGRGWPPGRGTRSPAGASAAASAAACTPRCGQPPSTEPRRTGRFVLMLPHSGTGRAAYACSARQQTGRKRSRREAAQARAWRQHANGRAADTAKLSGGSEPAPGTRAGTRAARCTQRSTRRGSYARRTARVVNVVSKPARASACAGRGSYCGPRDAARRQHSFSMHASATAWSTHHQLLLVPHRGWFRQPAASCSRARGRAAPPSGQHGPQRTSAWRAPRAEPAPGAKRRRSGREAAASSHHRSTPRQTQHARLSAAVCLGGCTALGGARTRVMCAWSAWSSYTRSSWLSWLVGGRFPRLPRLDGFGYAAQHLCHTREEAPAPGVMPPTCDKAADARAHAAPLAPPAGTAHRRSRTDEMPRSKRHAVQLPEYSP